MPDLFVIDTAKAGATSPYDCLIQHPQVFLSRVKESMCFSRDKYCAMSQDYYEDEYFDEAEYYPVRAEPPSITSTGPGKVAPRMKKDYGERPVKFTVSFRDPVSQPYSWYWNIVCESISYSTEIEKLEKIVGRDVSSWKAE